MLSTIYKGMIRILKFKVQVIQLPITNTSTSQVDGRRDSECNENDDNDDCIQHSIVTDR